MANQIAVATLSAATLVRAIRHHEQPDHPLTLPDEHASHDQWLSGHHVRGARSLAYRLHVPAPRLVEGKPSLVVMLHGCGQDAEDFANGTGMNELASQAGALVLYPEQTQRGNSQNCWNWFKPQHQRRGRGEPEMLASLIQSVIAERGVDPGCVYIAGLSAGGAMAAIMTRCYPELFAAVGIHSGVPAGVVADFSSALDVMRHGVPPGRGTASVPIPLIAFQGDADDVVHHGNATALVQGACRSLGIDALPEVISGRAPNFRSFKRRSYRLADSLPLVEHWLLVGGGHAWSGGLASGSCTAPGGPSASAEMLRFFLSHRAGQIRH